jgi:hypothetical protein
MKSAGLSIQKSAGLSIQDRRFFASKWSFSAALFSA